MPVDLHPGRAAGHARRRQCRRERDPQGRPRPISTSSTRRARRRSSPRISTDPSKPEAAAKEDLARFPKVKLFTIDEVFGGWAKAQKAISTRAAYSTRSSRRIADAWRRPFPTTCRPAAKRIALPAAERHSGLPSRIRLRRHLSRPDRARCRSRALVWRASARRARRALGDRDRGARRGGAQGVVRHRRSPRRSSTRSSGCWSPGC